MKLATYSDGSRDGQLVVVSRDLALAHYASGIATRLQQVLDDWNFLSPQLEELSQTLNHGKARHAFAFDPALCMAPLPRAGLWAEGGAYVGHLELTSLARGAELPADRRSRPPVTVGRSDALAGARDAIVAPGAGGVGFAGQLAAITGDVARGAGPDAALEGVRLLMLANDVTWHAEAPEEGAGPGAEPEPLATAFAPVAVTPDELLHAWSGGRVALNLECSWNGKRVGLCGAGESMTFPFGDLIAALARTRAVRAGSIVGSGPVVDADATRGYACLAAKRALEAIEGGSAKTGFMQAGDTVRFEMKGLDGASVFGAIEQRVVAPD